MEYKNVAIPLSTHRQATMLAFELDRTLGGKGGIVVELLTNWLQENRQEENRRDADTTIDGHSGVNHPG